MALSPEESPLHAPGRSAGPARPVIYLGHVVAALLDAVVCFSVAIGLGLMLRLLLEYLRSVPRSASDVMEFALAVLFLLCTASDIAFAASPGKSILGLVIRDASGAPASLRRLALRWALKYSAVWVALSGAGVTQLARHLSVGGPPLAALHEYVAYTALICGWSILLGSLMALHPTRRTLHDWIAGTAVFDASQIAETSEPLQRGFEVAPVPVVPLGDHSTRQPAPPPGSSTSDAVD